MTRIFIQRGVPGGSSSNPSRPPNTSLLQQAAAGTDEEQEKNSNLEATLSDDQDEPGSENKIVTTDVPVSASSSVDDEKVGLMNEYSDLRLGDQLGNSNNEQTAINLLQSDAVGSCPPPPPIPPPKSLNNDGNMTRAFSGNSNSVRIGLSRRTCIAWAPPSARSSPSASRPTSPKSYGENEGYNSADEQVPCYGSAYHDAERERMFELDLRRAKGYEIKRMLADGNCLFRAVADQVYGDPESYDMARQMCVDYMERERDHFSQFITEGFTSYCKRKRRDKVYGNNIEIQAFAEMYNRPIHIYSYSTEPINIFQGSYHTDVPPIRLSYHHSNHYNSVVDPRRLTIGAGLGFNSLRGSNVDRDQIKAAIKAQQDQLIENALLSEGRFYSDMELTEREMERMVMEASRSEYVARERLKQQLAYRESSTSHAEPSSSGEVTGSSTSNVEKGNADKALPDANLPGGVQLLLAMGFSYMHVIEAYSIFGEDVESMICYLVEMGGSVSPTFGGNRRKGKAAEGSSNPTKPH